MGTQNAARHFRGFAYQYIENYWQMKLNRFVDCTTEMELMHIK